MHIFGAGGTISRLLGQKLVDEAKERLSEPIGRNYLSSERLGGKGSLPWPSSYTGSAGLDSCVEGQCRYSSG